MVESEIKHTPFTEKHIQFGAKMMSFAGFYMPVEYSGITDEHIAVRKGVGVFDVSHMGEIWVSGPKSLDFLQYVTTNDVSRLTDGKVQYSCLPNGKGGIVDDILIYRFSNEKYLLVVNASNIDKDWLWLIEHNKWGAIMSNVSDKTAQLAVQGPLASKVIQKLTKFDVNELKYYTFKEVTLAGIPEIILSATGYTGAGGFELYFEKDHAQKIWEAIFDAGSSYGIKPIGLGERDTLRLEMGYCLYGNDIDDSTSPIEANLDWIVKFEPYKNFINKELFWKQKIEGVTRKRIGFKLKERGIPRQHYPIKDAQGNQIGEVTSGTQSPVLKEGIGMGYVKTEFSQPGKKIFIEIRGKLIEAEVVKLPFVSPTI